MTEKKAGYMISMSEECPYCGKRIYVRDDGKLFRPLTDEEVDKIEKGK